MADLDKHVSLLYNDINDCIKAFCIVDGSCFWFLEIRFLQNVETAKEIRKEGLSSGGGFMSFDLKTFDRQVFGQNEVWKENCRPIDRVDQTLCWPSVCRPNVCWPNVFWPNWGLHQSKCLSAKGLLAKCLLAKCLLVNCLLAKCLLAKYLLAKYLMTKYLLSKDPSAKCLQANCL